MFAAVLDNAPVYISFAASAAAKYNVSVDQPDNIGFLSVFFSQHESDAITSIRAISAGSVMMGGCTLIGNAPNMLVVFMATRYTYRTRIDIHQSDNQVHTDAELTTCHIENISFMRSLVTACLILIPMFVVIAFFML